MKFIKEDGKAYHFSTGDGDFIVPKKGLSKVALAKIKKMADGGEVGSPQVDPEKAKAFVSSYQATDTDKKIQNAVKHPIQAAADALGFAKGGVVQRFDDGGEAESDDSMDAQFDSPIEVGGDEANPLNVAPVAAADNRAPASIAAPDEEKPLVDPAAYDVAGTSVNQGLGPLNNQAVQNMATGQPLDAAAPAAKASDAAPSSGGTFDIAKLVNNQNALLNQKAKIDAQSSADNAARMDKFLAESTAVNDDYKAQLQDLNAEHEKLFNDVQNGKVDPKRFINNMSVGSKISSTLGIILGGLGAGRGGNNLALGVLQDQINKDIDSQKTDLQNKNNLLTQNLHRYGNLFAATAATKSQMGAMLSGEMMKQAYQTGNQTAVMNAQMMGNQLKMQAAPLIQAQAQQQAIQKLMADPNISPETKIRYGVPATQQKDAFGALDTSRYAQSNAGNLMAAFEQANKDNTIGNRAMHGGFAPQSVGTIENLFLPLIKDKEGRINEFEFDTVRKLIPQPGDTPTKIAQKRTGLQQFIQEKGHSQLGAFGIQTPKAIQTGAPVGNK